MNQLALALDHTIAEHQELKRDKERELEHSADAWAVALAGTAAETDADQNQY